MCADLTFIEQTHSYYFKGQLVPGVTTLLRPIHDFSKIPRDILEAAQARGTYVHRMTELYDLGELDEEALGAVEDGRWLGYLRAWKQFLEDHEPNWVEIEQMGYSQRYGFAGTWDRRGMLARRYKGRFLIDIKTAGEPADAWGVQTAAYRQIASEVDFDAILDRRATVQLAADGSYKFLEWTQGDDFLVFKALLTLHDWRARR